MVEGARLLSVCRGKTLPRVRIPPSPLLRSLDPTCRAPCGRARRRRRRRGGSVRAGLRRRYGCGEVRPVDLRPTRLAEHDASSGGGGAQLEHSSPIRTRSRTAPRRLAACWCAVDSLGVMPHASSRERAWPDPYADAWPAATGSGNLRHRNHGGAGTAEADAQLRCSCHGGRPVGPTGR